MTSTGDSFLKTAALAAQSVNIMSPSSHQWEKNSIPLMSNVRLHIFGNFNLALAAFILQLLYDDIAIFL